LAAVAKNRVRSLAKGTVDELIDIDGPLLVLFFEETSEVDREECCYISHFDFAVSYLGKTGLVSRNLGALKETRRTGWGSCLRIWTEPPDELCDGQKR
jgi:hypothetical protein